MARAKEFSLDLGKRIVNAHCKGEGYTKLSKRFQVSRIERLSEESSRNSKKAVFYKTCLEEGGRQKFRKLLSES